LLSSDGASRLVDRLEDAGLKVEPAGLGSLAHLEDADE